KFDSKTENKPSIPDQQESIVQQELIDGINDPQAIIEEIDPKTNDINICKRNAN
ncbi:hypothetical protein L9F63_012560, partial [Diploptera punctata]